MSYKFEVKTADIPNAGTDSNIFVKLIGERGHTEFKRLNGHISGNAFEQGDTDKFTVDYGQDIGDVYRMELRSDELWAAPGWLPEFFKITYDAPNRNTSEFDSFGWITNEKIHHYKVTSGYKHHVKPGWEFDNELHVDPAVIYQNPTNDVITLNKEIEHSYSVTFDMKETTSESISLGESIDVGIEIIDASIKAELQAQIQKDLGIKIDSTTTVKSTLTINIEKHTELDVFNRWMYRYANLNLIMGDTMFNNVNVLVDVIYDGYKANSKTLETA